MRTEIRFGAALLGLLTAVGCSGSADEPTIGDRIQRAGMSTPLTADDVQAFLEIVERLPDHEVPTFKSATFPAAAQTVSAKDLVAQWRHDFRSAYSPSVQARLWQSDARLTAALDSEDVDPTALAALLVRLASAVARDALDDRVQLSQLRKDAEASITALCRKFDNQQIDQVGQRVQLAEALKEATAFREFIRLLEAVPEGSVATIAEFRDQLRKHLPTSETMAAFEHRTESVVVPTSYESIAQPEN
jgi:hypothetical protein